MTLQEIFDKVAQHLRTQGRRSIDENGYLISHAPNGDMDPVGVIVPKDEMPEELRYKALFSGSPLRSWMKGRIGVRQTHLLHYLQNLHDHWGPAVEYGKKRPIDLEAGLRQVAYRFELKYSEPMYGAK